MEDCPDTMLAEYKTKYPDRVTPEKLAKIPGKKYVSQMLFDVESQGIRVYGPAYGKNKKSSTLLHMMDRESGDFKKAMDFLAYHEWACEERPIKIRAMQLGELKFHDDENGMEFLAVCRWPYGEPPAGKRNWLLEECWFLLRKERSMFKRCAAKYLKAAQDLFSGMWENFESDNEEEDD